jgi:hypothetical protein
VERFGWRDKDQLCSPVNRVPQTRKCQIFGEERSYQYTTRSSRTFLIARELLYTQLTLTMNHPYCKRLCTSVCQLSKHNECTGY